MLLATSTGRYFVADDTELSVCRRHDSSSVTAMHTNVALTFMTLPYHFRMLLDDIDPNLRDTARIIMPLNAQMQNIGHEDVHCTFLIAFHSDTQCFDALFLRVVACVCRTCDERRQETEESPKEIICTFPFVFCLPFCHNL